MCLFSGAARTSAAQVLSLGKADPGGSVLKCATGAGVGVEPGFPPPGFPRPGVIPPPPTQPATSRHALIAAIARIE
jgi:hypothetical protein